MIHEESHANRMGQITNQHLADGAARPLRSIRIGDSFCFFLEQKFDAVVQLGNDFRFGDEKAARRRNVHGAVGADRGVLAAGAPHREA